LLFVNAIVRRIVSSLFRRERKPSKSRLPLPTLVVKMWYFAIL